MSTPYPGRIPSNVAKDAKYSVVSGRSAAAMEVRLTYTISAGVRELLTTDRHDDLVAMVNEVKTAEQGQVGGVFYINEYRDVLVPAANRCFYAGNYEPDLEFEFEGALLGPRAPHGLQVGDRWLGPHVGIKYVITADRSDIKYEHMETPTRQRTELLSAHVGADAAKALAMRLCRFKGQTGGRVYINEASEFFSPPADGESDHIYLGSLDDDAWFHAPDVERPN